MLAHTLEILIDFGNVLVTVLAKCLSEALVKNAHHFSGRINSKAKCFATSICRSGVLVKHLTRQATVNG